MSEDTDALLRHAVGLRPSEPCPRQWALGDPLALRQLAVLDTRRMGLSPSRTVRLWSAKVRATFVVTR